MAMSLLLYPVIHILPFPFGINYWSSKFISFELELGWLDDEYHCHFLLPSCSQHYLNELFQVDSFYR